MPDSQFNFKSRGSQSSNEGDPDPSASDVERWLENLHHADRSLYNMMALEVWAIAKTMDNRIPGFWNRFMANRQVALKQFMQQKQSERSDSQ